MDVEFENDPLDDMDNLPAAGGLQQPNASRNGARNAMSSGNRGQVNSRPAANRARRPAGGTLNPQQASPISSINQYNNKW